MKEPMLQWIPLLTILVQALKAVPFVKQRTWLLPFVAAAMGLGLAVLCHWGDLDGERVLTGVALGLTAAGLYDAVKKPIDAVRAVRLAAEDERRISQGTK
ncbi:MAG: hypothetical protein JXL80_17540 [Planctomycetes bacterium]|nr:hypothetical protein [Planctomycetota bacterium]